MPTALIASALAQAGIRLLNQLKDLCQEYEEATENAVYVVLEHRIRAALDPDLIHDAFTEAVESYAQHADAYRRWLNVLADLLEHAGEEREAFCMNLWLAYLFRAQNAAEVLWDQYLEVQRLATVETGRYMPRSWGEWILPMQAFMGIAEQALGAQIPSFEDLFASEELLMLIEEIPLHPAGPDFGNQRGAYATGSQFDDTTLAGYLSMLVEHVGHIDPRGYLRSQQTSVPISDVYIPQQLIPLTDYTRHTDYMRYRTASYDESELYLYHEPLDNEDLSAYRTVGVTEVLAHNELVLVLGKSGSGKSTLLRHLALEHAQLLLNDRPAASDAPNGAEPEDLWPAHPLPLFVDLAEFVENRLSDEGLEEFIIRRSVELTRDDGTATLLRAMLGHGQGLLLVDGLDQAATDGQRQLLVDAVSQAADDWRASGNHVVVSSRFEGYNINPLSRLFVGYIIRPLDRSGIDNFLLQWRLALARVQRPMLPDERAWRQAHSEMLSLARQIATNRRLHALATTPLLLRLLVAIYRPGVMLSPQRAAIYQQVVDSLIREWRLPQTIGSQPAIQDREVMYVLSELAYWLHSSRPSGLIEEQELQQILGQIWGEKHPEAEPEDVTQAVRGFVGVLRVHTGILIEMAPQQYGFIFQELQEYFAARRLVASYREAPQRIREHLHDPRWNEIIRIAIGLVALRSADDAADLIETAILARGDRAAQFAHVSSPFESYLKRDLFFAARLLGAGVETRPDVTRVVVKELMRFWLEGDGHSLGRFTLIFDLARRYLMNLEGTSAARIAFQYAQDAVVAPITEQMQAYAIDALTFWPSMRDEAIETIVACGTDAPAIVRRAAALALGRYDSLPPSAFIYLMTLTADPDDEVQQLSQEALAHQNDIPYAALEMWLGYLRSEDPVERRVAMRRFEQMGALPPLVIAELLTLLNSNDAEVRQRAVEALASTSNLTDDALTAIFRSIADGDAAFRASAIQAFARPVVLPDQVIQQLALWADDPDIDVREQAIRVLGACKNEGEAIIEILVQRLEDGSDGMREAVIEPLVRKGQNHPYAVHMLSHVVADPIYQVRCAIADALKHVRRPSPEVQQILSTLLSDRVMIVRETVLNTIAQQQDPGPAVIEHLLSLVVMQDHPIRENAVAALANQTGLPDRALIGLVDALPLYAETQGQQIAACLREHRPLSADVIDGVMALAVARGDRAGGVTPQVRAVALQILGDALEDAPSALQVLIDGVQANEIEVRVAALRGLSSAREMSDGVIDLLREMMRSGYLRVRAAAGVALGALIRNLPYPPYEGEELLAVARDLAQVLADLPPNAAWEDDTEQQNEVLRALSWVVARTRPIVPRLPGES